MKTIEESIRNAQSEGYENEAAEAKVCQDIILLALSQSTLCRNATIKGGVVMRGISGNSRRATQDLDIDFIRYSLDDNSINEFVRRLNVLDGFTIRRVGEIQELKQQDYHGKRLYIRIDDMKGNSLESKVDLGVHKHLSIKQEEYCFDIAITDAGASLLINSKEQMYTEKLRSLLKFGVVSTRAKDIFDMCYLSEKVDTEELSNCFKTYIFTDPGMRENNLKDIIRRVMSTFTTNRYRRRLETSRKNWLDLDVEQVLQILLDHLKNLEIELAKKK